MGPPEPSFSPPSAVLLVPYNAPMFATSISTSLESFPMRKASPLLAPAAPLIVPSTLKSPVKSPSPLVLRVNTRDPESTNCKLPALFVVRSSGDSYIDQPLPPPKIKPSLGPGSLIVIEFTSVMLLLFISRVFDKLIVEPILAYVVPPDADRKV